MPILLLVLVSLVAGLLIGTAFYRLAPPQGATTALADAAEDVLVTTAIKDLVDRARPTLNPIAATLGPSFPSGHSSTAASFYAALALILARHRSARVRALLAGAAGAIAVAVASSRVLLDVHWLSDVIAGVTLGWVWFTICAVAFG